MPVFQTIQIVNTSLEACWDFFSDPANLSVITPPEMNFRIKFPQPMPAMYQGLIIRYTVSPLLGIPLEWITEITQVKDHEYFVDNQLKGPFRLWHHQHFFREVPGGVEMRDVVNYELPLGKFGEFFGLGIVQKRVQGIFDFRSAVIEKKFSRF
ncbi:MAG: SRPBCC family protein [Bacteroidales bacterium]|nr:SRPBCC family protein [Bacteroidales bacterium]